jgi:hypothetical protein
MAKVMAKRKHALGPKPWNGLNPNDLISYRNGLKELERLAEKVVYNPMRLPVPEGLAERLVSEAEVELAAEEAANDEKVA